MTAARDNVELFPKWNSNVTAAERLHELALIAEKHPARFQKLYVGWVGEENGKDYSNDNCLNMTTIEALGWLQNWAFQLLKRTTKDVE